MIAVKTFAEGVTQQIKQYLAEEYQNVECKVTEQQKNNGMIKIGIIFNKPGQKMAPVVYMEPFYDEVRNGKSMEQVMNGIADVCQKSFAVQELPESLDFTDYDSIKEYLSVQVINTKANQRMLSAVPHKEMEDLSVICRIEFPMTDGEGTGSVKVTYELMEQWGIEREKVYQKALENAVQNSPSVLMSMNDVMTEIMGLPTEPRNLLELEEGAEIPKEGMYVLSNPMRIHGSSVLAYPELPKQLEGLFPQGYYLLPSSVHELLVVPKDVGVSPKELGEMVREVNQKEVAHDEILSDRIYEFDSERRQLCQVPESMEKGREMER